MRKAGWVVVALAAAGAGKAEGLRAGVARVEITPAELMPMYGYANRRCGAAATGAHDGLYAKALVLEAGGERLAIVTMDLGSIVAEGLRREIAEKLGIGTVLLAASHTHSGPLFMTNDGTANAAYFGELERKLFGAVKQASASMFPARLGVGRGEIRLGYNRLLPREDGRSRALFDNLERVPYGPVDPEFTLLRVEDAGGAARALLVHYAAHSVVLGPTNCKYSADYPGAMQAKVESEIPGVQCMFVQGGAGDINPLFMARSGKEDEDFEVVRKMGETLAGEVVKAARGIRPAEPPETIRSKGEVLRFAGRWDKNRTIEAGITTVLIGRDIAIAAEPGEPMHRLQREWKRRAEVAHPLFYGYTYSSGGAWPGYIPDLRSAAHGGYGADVSTSIEVGAGESIVERHLIHLYGLLGMWRDKPGRP